MRESKNLYTNLAHKLLIDLNGILNTIEVCWCDKPHVILILSCPFNMQGRESYLHDYVNRYTLSLACIHTFTDLVW